MSYQARFDRAVQRKVADRYRRQGYDVVSQPQADDLPFDLGDFHPDLLVTKPGGERYVVEVKSSATPFSAEQYLEVAELVSREPGWRFLLVTEEEPMADLGETGQPSPLSWQQIDQRIERAGKLHSLGENEASFLSLWSALEAMMRSRAEEENIPLAHVGTKSVLNHLYSLGELSMEQYDTAIELLKTRNLIAHGFQAGGVAQEVDRLGALLRELTDLWRSGQQQEG